MSTTDDVVQLLNISRGGTIDRQEEIADENGIGFRVRFTGRFDELTRKVPRNIHVRWRVSKQIFVRRCARAAVEVDTGQDKEVCRQDAEEKAEEIRSLVEVAHKIA